MFHLELRNIKRIGQIVNRIFEETGEPRSRADFDLRDWAGVCFYFVWHVELTISSPFAGESSGITARCCIWLGEAF